MTTNDSTTTTELAPGTVPALVGNSITPEVELGFLEVGLPASAETEGAARWALAEINRLRDALGVIVRNVDAGAVHVSWCSDYAKRVLANAERSGLSADANG